MQKPRVHAQKGEKKEQGIPLWKINYLQRQAEREGKEVMEIQNNQKAIKWR